MQNVGSLFVDLFLNSRGYRQSLQDVEQNIAAAGKRMNQSLTLTPEIKLSLNRREFHESLREVESQAGKVAERMEKRLRLSPEVKLSLDSDGYGKSLRQLKQRTAEAAKDIQESLKLSPEIDLSLESRDYQKSLKEIEQQTTDAAQRMQQSLTFVPKLDRTAVAIAHLRLKRLQQSFAATETEALKLKKMKVSLSGGAKTHDQLETLQKSMQELKTVAVSLANLKVNVSGVANSQQQVAQLSSQLQSLPGQGKDTKKDPGPVKKIGATINNASAAAGSAVLGAGGNAIQAGIGATVGVVTDSIAKFNDYEQSLVEFVAKSQQTRDAVEPLSEEILQLALKTSQTPKQVAEAATALLSLGSSADEVQGQLEPVVKLTEASPGSTNLVSAKAIREGTNLFGGLGESADSLADKFAYLQSTTAIEGTAEFSTLFQNAGGAASNANIPFDELAASFAALRAGGIDAQKGSLGLQVILEKLSSPTAKASQQMAALGLNAFDAQGNFVGFIDVAQQLNQTMANATVEQRAKALFDIFGGSGANAIATLSNQLNQAESSFTNLSTTATGASQRISESLNDSPQQALKSLSSNLKVLQVQFGQALSPAIEGGVNALGQALVQAAKGDPFAALKGSATELGQTLSDPAISQALGQALGKTLETISIELAELVTEFNTFLTQNPDSIKELGAELVELAGGISEFATELAGAGAEVGQFLLELIPAITSLVAAATELLTAFRELPAPVQRMIVLAGGLTLAIAPVVTVFQTLLPLLKPLATGLLSVGKNTAIAKTGLQALAALKAGNLAGMTASLKLMVVQLKALAPLAAKAGVALGALTVVGGTAAAGATLYLQTRQMQEAEQTLDRLTAEEAAFSQAAINTQQKLIKATETRNKAKSTGVKLSQAEEAEEAAALDQSRQSLATLRQMLAAASEIEDLKGGFLGIGKEAAQAQNNARDSLIQRLNRLIADTERQAAAFQLAKRSQQALTQVADSGFIGPRLPEVEALNDQMNQVNLAAQSQVDALASQQDVLATGLRQSADDLQRQLAAAREQAAGFIQGITESIEDVGFTIQRLNLDTERTLFQAELERGLGITDGFLRDYTNGILKLFDLSQQSLKFSLDQQQNQIQSARMIASKEAEAGKIFQTANSALQQSSVALAGSSVPGMGRGRDGRVLESIPFQGVEVTAAVDSSGEPGLDYVVSNGQRGARFGALVSGEVIEIEPNQNWENHNPSAGGPRGLGNYVIVRAFDEVSGQVVDMLYAHLDDVLVEVGDQVGVGTILGTQGRTGSTTGPHVSLDFYGEDSYSTTPEALAMRDRLAQRLIQNPDFFNDLIQAPPPAQASNSIDSLTAAFPSVPGTARFGQFVASPIVAAPITAVPITAAPEEQQPIDLSRSREQLVTAVLSILEAPTRQGRVDVAQVIVNRAGNNLNNLGTSPIDQAFADGQFQPFFSVADGGYGIGREQIQDDESAISALVKSGRFNSAQAEVALQNFFDDVNNPAMTAISQRDIGSIVYFNGVSEKRAMQPQDFTRSANENFFGHGWFEDTNQYAFIPLSSLFDGNGLNSNGAASPMGSSTTSLLSSGSEEVAAIGLDLENAMQELKNSEEQLLEARARNLESKNQLNTVEQKNLQAELAALLKQEQQSKAREGLVLQRQIEDDAARNQPDTVTNRLIVDQRAINRTAADRESDLQLKATGIEKYILTLEELLAEGERLTAVGEASPEILARLEALRPLLSDSQTLLQEYNAAIESNTQVAEKEIQARQKAAALERQTQQREIINRSQQGQINSLRGIQSQRSLYGLESPQAAEQQARLQQAINYRNQLADLEQFAKKTEASTERVAQLRGQIEQLNQAELAKITAQFNPLTEALRGVNEQGRTAVKDILKGNAGIGEALFTAGENLSNQFIDMAVDEFFDANFAKLFGGLQDEIPADYSPEEFPELAMEAGTRFQADVFAAGEMFRQQIALSVQLFKDGQSSPGIGLDRDLASNLSLTGEFVESNFPITNIDPYRANAHERFGRLSLLDTPLDLFSKVAEQSLSLTGESVAARSAFRPFDPLRGIIHHSGKPTLLSTPFNLFSDDAATAPAASYVPKLDELALTTGAESAAQTITMASETAATNLAEGGVGSAQGLLGSLSAGLPTLLGSLGSTFGGKTGGLIGSLAGIILPNLFGGGLFGGLFGSGGAAPAVGLDPILNFSSGGEVGSGSLGPILKLAEEIGEAEKREGYGAELVMAKRGEVILNQVQQKSLAQDIARPIANYYAGSGVIGQALASPMTIGGAAGSNNVINVPVTINSEGGVSGGSLNAAKLSNAVRAAVVAEIQEQKRGGGALA